MKKKLSMALLALAFLSTEALAGSWTHDVSHSRKGGTQIRVLSPDATVTVEVNGRSDTAPMIATLPNRDAYVPVKVSFGGRVVLSFKVEVRRWHETLVKIRKPAAQPHRPRGRVMEYIGTVFNNTQWCADADQGTYRYEFLRDGRTVRSMVVDMSKSEVNVRMAAGAYKVRMFKQNPQGKFVYQQTKDAAVSKDGWSFTFGCAKPKNARPRSNGQPFRYTIANCSRRSVRLVIGNVGSFDVGPRSQWVGTLKQTGQFRARVMAFSTRTQRWRTAGYHTLTIRPNGRAKIGCR